MPSLKGITRLGMIGTLNVCLSMLLLQMAIHFGKASLAAVIISINPLFVSLFAYVILKERLRIAQVVGMLLALAGIALLVLSESELRRGTYTNLPLSIALAILASITFGLYTVLTKRSVADCGNMVTNSFSFIIGALVLFVFNLLSGKPMLPDQSMAGIGLTLYLGLFVTGIAYLLYFEAMKVLPANKASMYFFLKPFIAAALAWFLLDEKLGLYQIIAVMLIVFGMNVDRIWGVVMAKKGID